MIIISKVLMFLIFQVSFLNPDLYILVLVVLRLIKGFIARTKLRNVMKISHCEINPVLRSNIFVIIALLKREVLINSQNFSNYTMF